MRTRREIARNRTDRLRRFLQNTIEGSVAYVNDNPHLDFRTIVESDLRQMMGRFAWQEKRRQKFGIVGPTGLKPFSTNVLRNEDGTYTVTSKGNASANDGDNNIYIVDSDGNRTGETIGESLTSHSFYDDSENAVDGAVIDLNSTDGQKFIDDEIIADHPFIGRYMANATGGKHFDFKERGMTEALAEGRTEIQQRYRGSKASNDKIGSARDFGNGAAGIVAGRFGLSWKASRLGFDALETSQHSSVFSVGLPGGGTSIMFNINFTSEKTPTQKAQKLGYAIGIELNKEDGKIKF